MAVNPTPTTIQQNLPSPYIEGALTSLSERLLPLLSTSAAINTGSYAPQVAGINQFTQAGQQQAARQAGLGSLGFDPTTGTVTKKNVSFGDVFSSMKHANENPSMSAIPNRDGKDSTEMFDSKQTVSLFSAAKQFSSYIKEKAPTTLTKQDNTENYLLQRKSILSNLMGKRIKLTMPGNFNLTSGFNVNVIAPNFGKKEKGGENADETVSGKYLIIATRHMIGYDKHETVIEVASTSTNVPFIPQASMNQVKEILNY